MVNKFKSMYSSYYLKRKALKTLDSKPKPNQINCTTPMTPFKEILQNNVTR